MKKSELFFNVISVASDFLTIFLAASLAYFFRYRVETLPVLFELSYSQYVQLILGAIFFLLLLFALSGLYAQKSTRSFVREIGRVTVGVSAGLMIVVVLFFFNRNLFPSRLIILMSWIFTILLVSLGRGILLLVQRNLLAKGVGRHRLIVIEGGSESQLIREIEGDSRLGYEIVGRMKFSSEVMVLLEQKHRHERIDELIQADPKLSAGETLQLVEFCQELGIKFSYLPNILESHRAQVETDVVGTLPVIRLKATPLDGWGKVVKRVMDLAVSGIGLIIFSPVFIFISLTIRLDSSGPIFFHQRRGSSFHNFEFFKFRTMFHDLSEGTLSGDQMRAQLEVQNARVGPYVKIKNDPRVTRVGRFLRRTKLDELPQLWHVLRGQMSLVGPRIHMIREVEKFENQYKRLYTIKPGAVGLAQINQFYNPELSFQEEIRLDLFYIENWSVWLDVYIIFKTLVLLVTKQPKGNY